MPPTKPRVYDTRNRYRSGKFRDRTGEVIGDLLVLGWAGMFKHQSHWYMRCVCGVECIKQFGPFRNCGTHPRPYRTLATLLPNGRHGYHNQWFLKGPDGSLMSMSQAARMAGMARETLRARIRKGWPEEDWYRPHAYKPKIKIIEFAPPRERLRKYSRTWQTKRERAGTRPTRKR